jgi:hypothetical protein
MSIGGIRKSFRTSWGFDEDSLGLVTMLPFFVGPEHLSMSALFKSKEVRQGCKHGVLKSSVTRCPDSPDEVMRIDFRSWMNRHLQLERVQPENQHRHWYHCQSRPLHSLLLDGHGQLWRQSITSRWFASPIVRSGVVCRVYCALWSPVQSLTSGDSHTSVGSWWSRSQSSARTDIAVRAKM